MEPLIKIVNDFKLHIIFVKKSILQVLSLSLTTINKMSLTNTKSYITVFWKVESYYPAGIVHAQSTIFWTGALIPAYLQTSTSPPELVTFL